MLSTILNFLVRLVIVFVKTLGITAVQTLAALILVSLISAIVVRAQELQAARNAKSTTETR